MKKRTLRTLLKGSIPAAIILLVLTIVDYAVWDGANIISLLIAWALFIAWLAILVMWRAASAHRRIDSEPEHPGITVYPRNHG